MKDLSPMATRFTRSKISVYVNHVYPLLVLASDDADAEMGDRMPKHGLLAYVRKALWNICATVEACMTELVRS